MNKETILVTGASSGIGLELARSFVHDGADFVLVARRRDLLENLAGELRHAGADVRILPADLSEPDAPEKIFEELGGEDAGVDILINNAGFGARGSFAELDEQRQAAILQVNITALTRLSRLFLPQMIRHGRGGILNVASTGGFQPGPYMSVYFATKAYVLSFTEALAEETRNTGVTVTCLCPGVTVSEFHRVAGTEQMAMMKFGAAPAARVAELGHRAFRAGRVVVIDGWFNRLLVQSLRFSPRLVVRKLVALLIG
jgi:short-subunit dehydrogenase